MLEIERHDIVERIRFDNPWWSGGTTRLAFQDSPRRHYFVDFLDTVVQRSVRRAVVLMGPRRVGKTVMVYHAIRALLDRGVDPRHILYVSIDTPVYAGLSLEQLLNEFRGLFDHARETELTVFFDEIQYLKNWEVHLKSLVDSFPDCKFVVTGSAAAALRLKSVESGAGRFSEFVLPSLTFAEYLDFVDAGGLVTTVTAEDSGTRRYVASDIEALNRHFQDYLNFGGYPEAVLSRAIQQESEQYIRHDIIDKVLLRDLPSFYGIDDTQELNTFFTRLAYATGDEMNLEGLSKDSGVAKNTLKRYLEYLEAAFLIKRVDRIDQNARRFRRAMHFKIYLTNPSMRAALFGPVDVDSKAMGRLVETAVLSQWQHQEQTKLHYARWDGGEIDFVRLDTLEQRPAWAVEVKWTDRPFGERRDLEGCVAFANRHPDMGRILVTSRTEQGRLTHRGVDLEFRPVSLYAYETGKEAFSLAARFRRRTATP